MGRAGVFYVLNLGLSMDWEANRDLRHGDTDLDGLFVVGTEPLA